MVVCGNDEVDGPCRITYDGAHDELFNLTNTELFTHHFLASLLAHVDNHGASFSAARKVIIDCENLLPHGIQQRVVTLPLVIEAFFEYINLLHNLPGCNCPICGQYLVAILEMPWDTKSLMTNLVPNQALASQQEVHASRLR